MMRYLLPGILRFHAPVEKIRDVGILFGFRDAEAGPDPPRSPTSPRMLARDCGSKTTGQP